MVSQGKSLPLSLTDAMKMWNAYSSVPVHTALQALQCVLKA